MPSSNTSQFYLETRFLTDAFFFFLPAAMSSVLGLSSSILLRRTVLSLEICTALLKEKARYY